MNTRGTQTLGQAEDGAIEEVLNREANIGDLMAALMNFPPCDLPMR